jgi:hypothetical protein
MHASSSSTESTSASTSWLVISIAISLLNTAISGAFAQSEFFVAVIVTTTTSSNVAASSLFSLKTVIVVITASSSVVVASLRAELFVNLAKAIAQRTAAITTTS